VGVGGIVLLLGYLTVGQVSAHRRAGHDEGDRAQPPRALSHHVRIAQGGSPTADLRGYGPLTVFPPQEAHKATRTSRSPHARTDRSRTRTPQARTPQARTPQAPAARPHNGAPHAAARTLNDQGGIVLGWLTRIVLFFAVAGLALFDAISNRHHRDDRRRPGVLRCAAGVRRLQDEQERAIGLQRGGRCRRLETPPTSSHTDDFKVDDDGTVHLTVSRNATTPDHLPHRADQGLGTHRAPRDVKAVDG
jgi:hypothetical protein